MTRPSAVFMLLAALAAWPARAQNAELRGLDLVLDAAERVLDDDAARPADVTAAESALRPAAAALVARLDAQRQAFRTVAARPLPAKAAARLAQAEAAFEQGQGRLARLLRELALSGAAARARLDPAARRNRAALAREARAIVAQLELVARPEPLSSELKLRPPALRAPALPAAAPEAAGRASEAPAAATPIGVVPPELQNLADQLAGPFEAYAWVRQSVAPELYYGLAKGALGALRDQRANDADSAALLVALLRAKGVPARFVVGTAEVPAATLRRLVGVEGNVEDALRALEQAGIPNEPVSGPGGIGSVKLGRVWVEAYVPYVNYRGIDLDTQGKAWIPLDPAFQLFEPAGGVDVVAELGFDPRAAWDEYLQAPRSQTPLEFVRAQVEALLQAQRPGTSYTDVLARRTTEREVLGILPNTLPYLATVAETGFDLPASLAHEVRLVGKLQGATVLDAVFPAADLLARRVTLSYVPFSAEDAAVVALFGGMYQTPPYLFEVRPVVSFDGVESAAGSAPVGFGVKYALELELRTPAGSEHVTNTVLAGNLTALAVAGSDSQLAELPNDAAGRILSGLATRYLARWNASDAELARLLRVVPVRPTLSAVFLMSAVEVAYAGGDPLFPLTFDWKGLDVDADFRPLAPVGVEQRARESAFALLSGLEGSWLEARVLADDLSVASISTVGAIQAAHAQSIAVLDVTRDNAEAVVPGLPFDATVKAEVLDAALRGQLVRIPSAAVADQAWSGVGYVVLDEESGAAAYQLQGGHSGGTTTPAPNDFPAWLSRPFTDPGVGPFTCTRVQPNTVEMKSQDNQFGTANKKLDDPLEVLVLDAESRPLEGACVTFTVIGGGARVVSPLTDQEVTALTVFSDSEGVARVGLRFGKSTRDLPGYWCEDGRTCGPGQDEYTQVGFNLIAVRAGAAVMKDVFTHFAKPDPQCDDQGGNCITTLRLTTPAEREGAFNLQVGGLMGANVLDQYDNPVSNIKVTFRFDPPLQQSSLPAGWYHTRAVSSSAEAPGLVLKPKDYLDCIAANPNPSRHDCANEAPMHELPSGPFGVYAYAVIGDSTVTDYRYEIYKAPSRFDATATFSTAGWICTSSDPHACLLDQPQTIVTTTTRPRRVNSAGNFIEAYPLGGQGDVTVSADVLIERNYVLEEGSDSDGPIYRARGDNNWTRKPLTDSTFNLSALTAGTGIPGQAPHVGNGDYRAQMTMASTPQENIVKISSKHTPEVVHYTSRDRDRVDAAQSPVSDDNGTKRATRTPDPSRPWQGDFRFPLWGAEVKIDKIEPQPLWVTKQGRTTHSTLVRHQILPGQWRALLEPAQVYFKVTAADGSAPVEGTGNRGEVFTIPRDAPLQEGTYQAHIEVRSVDLNDGKIEATPKEVRAGVVDLLLDFNNDTLVDEQDATKVANEPGATFHFWEADADRVSKAAGSDEENALHILEEYASARLTLPEALGADDRVALTLRGAGSKFHVAKHAGDSGTGCGTKSYLCALAAGNAQLALIQSEVVSTSGTAEITSLQPGAGTNDYVFRGDGPLLDDEGILALERWVDGRWEAVIERSVSIEPLLRYMSIVSARGPDQTVAPQAVPVGTWKELPPVDKAPRVIVFVHGFNVTELRAIDAWFPIGFKRLYWGGVKLLEAQAEPSQRYQFVAFTWTGDRTSLTLPALAYPENEFNAQQTGVPLSLFLTRELAGREIVVMAHSLGNMVVNSALTFAPPGTVRTYVMNDAAVAVEAFHNGGGPYAPDALEEDALGDYTRRYGRPDDHGSGGIPILLPRQDWIDQWQSMVSTRLLPSTCPGRAPLSDHFVWQQELSAMQSVNPNLATPEYDVRWRKFAPFDSAWTRVYGANLGATSLVNTYNPNDSVLRLTGTFPSAWLAAQKLQKPHGFSLGLFGDGRCVLYWGRLQDMGLAGESDLWSVAGGWGGIAQPAAGPARAALTRAWAERAYWFPTISGAAATAPVPGATNHSFVDYGNDYHSYIGPDRPLSGVFPVYDYFKSVIR